MNEHYIVARLREHYNGNSNAIAHKRQQQPKKRQKLTRVCLGSQLHHSQMKCTNKWFECLTHLFAHMSLSSSLNSFSFCSLVVVAYTETERKRETCPNDLHAIYKLDIINITTTSNNRLCLSVSVWALHAVIYHSVVTFVVWNSKRVKWQLFCIWII